MTPQQSDLQDEKSIICYIVDFFMGISMVIGGLAILLFSIFLGKGWGLIVFCVVLFFFCLAVGVWEIKSAIEEMKKIDNEPRT